MSIMGEFHDDRMSISDGGSNEDRVIQRCDDADDEVMLKRVYRYERYDNIF